MAIVLTVILLTGSASRPNAYDEPEQGIYVQIDHGNDMDWAYRPAVDPEAYDYYSTISIDEQPTAAELEG